MTWRPQLNVVCTRCGKPRGLRHVCISTRARKPRSKMRVTFGKCPRCKKPHGNPLTHVCRTRTDFKRRKAQQDKQQRADARAAARPRQPSKRPAHDYLTCTDNDCQRPLCVAFKTGRLIGDREGYERGWLQGHDLGYREGFAHGFAQATATAGR